jgi:hypothetical protein
VRFVPQTAQDRRQIIENEKNDYQHLKSNVALLLQQVHELQLHTGLTSKFNTTTEVNKKVDIASQSVNAER